MKNKIVIFIYILILPQVLMGQIDKVFSDHSFDKLGAGLRQQAKAASYSLQLSNPVDFTLEYKKNLKEQISKNAMVEVDHSLNLKMEITGSLDMGDFIIENIKYQSQEGIFVTANLYRPKAEGIYPAVITTHGHWANGRRTEIVQTTAQLLALNGFVCLAVDAWGVGERTTDPLVHEYHGSNLGASLMNVGRTLLGMQLIDNIRGVDLLCSLSYVDANNIGATGASGGGNQAMWLAAMDERVKAVIPVVSVGTFESYVMNSNCVCELLPHGLTFTEEDAVLGLIAPRALNIFTAMNDANSSFVQSRMLRSYNTAREVYKLLGKEDHINYRLFNTGHGYWEDMQMQMLAWFTKQLKNRELDSKSIGVDRVAIQAIEKLATFPNGDRDARVLSTEAYCKLEGNRLRNKMLLDEALNATNKREELKRIMSLDKQSTIREIHSSSSNTVWDKIIIEQEDGSLIPLLHKAPLEGSNYSIILNSLGKDSISSSRLLSLEQSKDGFILVDLWGIGESGSVEAHKIDGALPAFHTLSRSTLWLGKSIIGKWIAELASVVEVAVNKYNASSLTIEANKETAIAGLLYTTLENRVHNLIIDDMPTSYLFDNRENVDYYNMAIHIPHFLEWGDVSLALALSNTNVSLINANSMSGTTLSVKSKQELEQEVKNLRKKMGLKTNKHNTITIY